MTFDPLQLAVAAFVAIVSLTVILTPFVWAFRWSRGDDIDRRYVVPLIMTGFLALFWVGFTGARMVLNILGFY